MIKAIALTAIAATLVIGAWSIHPIAGVFAALLVVDQVGYWFA